MPARFERLSPAQRAVLEERYGKRRNSGIVLIAVIAALIATTWLVRTAWHHANPEISISPVKYQTINDESISLTFDLIRRDPTTRMICTLIALDIDRNVVGELDISVPPGQRRVERVTTSIPTRLRAVNASAERCRVATDAKSKSDK